MSKIVAWVKLTPSPEQAAVLASALRALDTHATRVAKVARERGVMRNYEPREHAYHQSRAAGVGSLAASEAVQLHARSFRAGKLAGPAR
ncbi:hypothetical protein [Nocardiopsis alborubida]|uniref:hypothetical protein n=1 Tax=Nocardiopsis alborubida TaxID=146802 RepID=UPI001E362058|nr:hypothetical protein [Nocardiopsis alborubida]